MVIFFLIMMEDIAMYLHAERSSREAEMNDEGVTSSGGISCTWENFSFGNLGGEPGTMAEEKLACMSRRQTNGFKREQKVWRTRGNRRPDECQAVGKGPCEVNDCEYKVGPR